MMALKALGYSMNTSDESQIQEAYNWLVQCVQTMKPEIVTDEIIDNMAQGRKALGLIYSGDATYVINENENMGYYLPEGGTTSGPMPWSFRRMRRIRNSHMHLSIMRAIMTELMTIQVM